jgi:sirohydrochlorin ferrochelatase
MNTPTLLLVDNGSSRPESALNLRRLALSLSEAVGQTVHPVSLQHAHKIPPAALEGIAADTFHPFMSRRLGKGDREFVLLPLFFGPSRALSSFIPDQLTRLSAEFGSFRLTQAKVLCPLPEGEPRLADILCQQLPTTKTPRRIILVDHGSPIPEISAVRRYLAREMRNRLPAEDQLLEAVMERREGSDYDFNGELLEQVLRQKLAEDSATPTVLSLLFISPGRHAGSGGDIERICQSVTADHPGLRIEISGLVGEHEGLIPILSDRLNALLQNSGDNS